MPAGLFLIHYLYTAVEAHNGAGMVDAAVGEALVTA